MRELEALLEKRWILKSEDKELYYRIRDAIGQIRPFVTEKLGCQLVENSLLVKLEKIPATPEGFMGILDFTSKEEYAYLCILLMFLEDKDAQEQFILSQLTEYIVSNMPSGTVDWTIYTCRRQLIRVLRYAVGQGILKVTDGRDDVFMDEQSGEVLYENTGASRYFMKNFSRDITEYQKPEDFQESDWFEMDEDRGIARRHRVYKRLIFSVGMYKEDGMDEDFSYLKYYGKRLSDDLERMFDCQVHIHKGSAYFLTEENCKIGEEFPGNNVLSDIILLCCSRIREGIEKKELKVLQDETILVENETFANMIAEVQERYRQGFTKAYREMSRQEFVQTVTEKMQNWTFLSYRDSKVVLRPSCGKMMGRYPKDFEEKVEKKDE